MIIRQHGLGHSSIKIPRASQEKRKNFTFPQRSRQGLFLKPQQQNQQSSLLHTTPLLFPPLSSTLRRLECSADCEVIPERRGGSSGVQIPCSFKKKNEKKDKKISSSGRIGGLRFCGIVLFLEMAG